jgi:hypothetical protein
VDVDSGSVWECHAMVDITGSLVLALVVAALVFIFAPRPS